MSIIAMPAGLLCGSFSIGQHRYDLTEVSESTGASQARSLGPPRWLLSMSAPDRGLSETNAALWEAMILQLRGNTNFLSAWDIVKVAPRGTCRGTMTLSGAHAQGATSVVIAVTGQSGNTLIAGDWLQIGTGTSSQLVKVMATATAGASTITVVVEPPIRPAAGFSGGTAVTWDKALGHYKLVSEAAQWSYVPGFNTVSGFAIDLMEQWT